MNQTASRAADMSVTPTRRDAAAGAVLALTAASATSRAECAEQRLEDLLATATRRNPIDPSQRLERYGPTSPGRLTPLGASGDPSFTAYAVVEHPHLFFLYGGRPHLRFDNLQALGVTYPDHHPAQNTGRVAFSTDAASLELLLGVSGSAGYRVLVDGLYVSRAAVRTRRASGGARDHVRLELPPHSPARRLRRIDVEMSSPEGSFGGVAVPPGARLSASPLRPGYRIACLGDSIAAGTGCADQNDAWTIVAGYMLGGVGLDMVQVALGGAGFVNGGPAWKASAHLFDLKRRGYDEIWVALGTNDRGAFADAFKTAAVDVLRSVRRLAPGAPILVLGIPRPDDRDAEALEAYLEAAFHTWDDPHSAWVPFQGRQKLFTGSAAGPGNFSADRFGGGLDGRDDTHPNQAGHRYMGAYVARRRRALQLA